ncbi:MAG: HEPN domain-containing protein [Cyanobacteria bacterium J06581_3]
MSNKNADYEGLGEAIQSLGFTSKKDHWYAKPEKMSKPYIRCLKAMAQNTLLLTSGAVESLPEQQDNLNKVENLLGSMQSVEIIDAQDPSNMIPLEKDKLRALSNLLKHRIQLFEDTKKIHSNVYIVSMVSCFEAFIQDLVYEILVCYPKNLRSSKSLTYQEILEHSDMASLISFMAQKESRKSTEGKVEDYLRQLSKRFGLNTIDSLSEIGVIREGVGNMTGLRNVIVHNGGIVDTAFIRRYPKIGFKEGDSTELTMPELARVSEFFRLTASIIETSITEKFKLVAVVSWSEESEVYLDEILSLEDLIEG